MPPRPLRILVAFLFAVVPAVGLFAPPGDGPPVVSIRIEGNRAVSEAYILTVIRTRRGEPYDPDVAGADVARLYRTGLFARVRIGHEPGPGGTAVTVTVEENRIPVDIRIEGIPRGWGRAIARRGDWPDRPENRRPASPDWIEAQRVLIREFLRGKGHAGGTVAPRWEETDLGPELVFDVESGDRVRIGRFRLRGNEAFSDRVIRKRAGVESTPGFWLFRWLYRKSFDPVAWEEDIRRVEGFYRTEGWLDAEVTAETERVDGKILLRIRVDEGERYVLSSVEIEGTTALSEERLREEIRSVPGDPYVPRLAREDRDRIELLYGDHGYLLRNLEILPAYDVEARTVRLRFRIVEGPRIRIHRVRIEGNTDTRDRVIRRQIPLVPGEPLNLRKILAAQRRLREMQYFDRVDWDLETVEGDRSGTLRDLVYRVSEGPTGGLQFGAGISSDDDVIGRVQFTQRNFDIRRLDDFPWNGGGQGFSALAAPGRFRSQYTLAFDEPWLFDRPVGFGIDGGRRSREFADYTQVFKGGELTLSRRWDFRWDRLESDDREDRLTVGVVYRGERVEVNDVSSDASATVRDAEGKTTVQSLRPFLFRDRTDSRQNPTQGWDFNLSYEYAGDFFSGVDFSRARVESNHHLRLRVDRNENPHVLSFGGRLGWIESHSNTREIPIFERFFAGGSSSLRGFEFRTVGPKQDFEPIGGQTLIVGNMEYTFPLTSDNLIRGAGFYDVGTVEDEFDSSPFDELRSSVGVGLRLRMPFLGQQVPIRFDWGFPIEKEHEDEREVFSFAMGVVF